MIGTTSAIECWLTEKSRVMYSPIAKLSGFIDLVGVPGVYPAGALLPQICSGIMPELLACAIIAVKY